MTGSSNSGRADWRGDEYAAESHHHRSYDAWFLERLPPEPDDVIVDLGCGSGEFTSQLADLVPEGRVIGIDPDPSMLQAARRHTNPGLEFVQASALELDRVVEAGSVDKVMSRAMLHWLPLHSYRDVFEVVLRALRPGGWYHSESAGAGNVPQLTAVLNDLAARFRVAELPPFPDAGTVFDLVDEAGFSIPAEGVRTVAQRRQFTEEQALGLLRTQGAVAVSRQADENQKESIADAAAASLERLRRFDGTFDQTFVRLEILAQKAA